VARFPGRKTPRRAIAGRFSRVPDFLILDEPTNHLDHRLDRMAEDFLARYAGTCLFVTHDRYFLDRVATRIVELSRGEFTSYDGNYTDYLLARAQRQAVEERRTSTPEVFKTGTAMGEKSARARRTKSVDRVERYSRWPRRKHGGGARRRVDYPHTAEARESHH